MRQPQEFGRYVLLERISVGGMAEVFKAKPLQGEGNGKILAIKRILPSMAEDADFIQMFIDEAKISGQLHHLNIAEIYELGRVDNSHFIAMEYVWGKDLLQMQNRFRRLRQTMKPAMAAFIASRICQGLDYAHRKTDASGKLLGIIHRDVSPQNILVSYEGEIKVIDFGIAKAASRSTRTQAGVLKGKFGYMSPEQVRGLPLDRRSDVFAIATILYEMLTSERLFLGESDFATLEKVRNVDVPPPSKVCPACSPDLERIILKGLAREADERYQWASEMAVELDAFLEQNDPTFTTALLSNWMKTQFAAEWKREGAVLEQQAKLDPKAALAAAAAGPEAVKEAPAAPAASNDADVDAALAAAALSPADLPTEDELQGEATQISAPMMEMGEEGGSGPAPSLTAECAVDPHPRARRGASGPARTEDGDPGLGRDIGEQRSRRRRARRARAASESIDRHPGRTRVTARIPSAACRALFDGGWRAIGGGGRGFSALEPARGPAGVRAGHAAPPPAGKEIWLRQGHPHRHCGRGGADRGGAGRTCLLSQPDSA